MLSIRPNCEYCDRDLPPDSAEAMICSFECTFCADCVDTVLSNVCPNCGGGFERRPVRPAMAWRTGACLSNQPASSQRVHMKQDVDLLPAFIETIRKIPPQER